ncbi:hypothetical protein [Altererythrobacter fulvus]|uniref:hypothetical protein n=1 Tax=Caenibius fulvus TaxID=2126012 RepID=UPI00301A2B17
MSAMRMMAGASLLVLGLTVAACGGGVDSTPTPTPTPTETPTPSPSPVVPYITVAEAFASPSNKIFRSGGVTWSKTGTADATGHKNFAFGTAFVVGYNETTDTYKVTPVSFGSSASGTALDAVEFPIGSATPGATSSFTKTTSGVTDTFNIAIPQVASVPLSYTMLFDFTRSTSSTGKVERWLTVGGIPTQSGDMPRTGSATYNMMVDGSATRDGDSKTYMLGGLSSGTFSANFADSKITTTLNLKGEATGGATSDFGTVNGTSTFISGSPVFGGELTGANSTKGAFSGSFFGPQAGEVGYSWYFLGSDFDAQGFAAGKKQE